VTWKTEAFVTNKVISTAVTGGASEVRVLVIGDSVGDTFALSLRRAGVTYAPAFTWTMMGTQDADPDKNEAIGGKTYSWWWDPDASAPNLFTTQPGNVGTFNYEYYVANSLGGVRPTHIVTEMGGNASVGNLGYYITEDVMRSAAITEMRALSNIIANIRNGGDTTVRILIAHPHTTADGEGAAENAQQTQITKRYRYVFGSLLEEWFGSRAPASGTTPGVGEERTWVINPSAALDPLNAYLGFEISESGVSSGQAYMVRTLPITYNGVTYEPGSVFTGLASPSTFTGSGTIIKVFQRYPIYTSSPASRKVWETRTTSVVHPYDVDFFPCGIGAAAAVAATKD
jgi:hypothetical protein